MKTLYEWFAQSTRDHPTLVALRAGGIDVSYQDLDAAAARVGRDILGDHGGRPARIAFLASRTVGAYVSYVAGLRLGVTVVPLNTENPAARNAGILRLAGVEVLLYPESDKDLAAELHDATGIRLLEVPESYVHEPAGADLPAPHRPGLEELAYIVFTSGSTGTPKGVPIKHTNISTYLSYVIPLFDGGPGVRISQTSDMSWDLSVYNIWVAWGAGGAVVVPSKTELLTPCRHISADAITHWFSVPSSITMSRWLGELTPDSMPTLRWSLFGGELLTVDNARAWRDAAPQGILANVYGPTETTVTCLTYRLPDQPCAWPRAPLGALPMGPSYPTVESAVVGPDGRRGQEGELLIRGPQRFDGYLDPADNIGRFAHWDADGGFRVYDGAEPLTADHWYRTGDRVRVQPEGYAFLGRLDNQVKVYGYRVELGDVEAAVRRHPGVDEAVVVPRVAEDGATELAGFYTGQSTVDDVMRFLEEQVPAYMVPRFLFQRDVFPRTVNGKIDRKLLAEEAS